MSDRADETRREKLGFRFVMAFDGGDLDALAVLWEEAESDAELGRLFCELTDSISGPDIEPLRAGEGDRRPKAGAEGRPSESATDSSSHRCPPCSESHGSLVLSRRQDEKVLINHNVTVTVVRIEGNQVRLQFTAPKYIPIYRHEIVEAMGQRPAPLEEDLTFSED